MVDIAANHGKNDDSEVTVSIVTVMATTPQHHNTPSTNYQSGVPNVGGCRWFLTDPIEVSSQNMGTELLSVAMALMRALPSLLLAQLSTSRCVITHGCCTAHHLLLLLLLLLLLVTTTSRQVSGSVD